MKRILVFGMTENPGGVESFLMNYYKNIDREKLQFDFLCNSHEPIAYEDEIKQMGGRTYHITARSKNPLQYKKELEAFYKENSKTYDTIWVNVSSLANIDYLIMAKKYGITNRIIHSHNSMNMDSKLRGLLHEKNKKRIQSIATHFWACSPDAAKWFYSDPLLPQVMIIRNAIDVRKMHFDNEKREMIRKEHGWEDAYLVGNIGRLHFQKNQMFMLDIFAELVKQMPQAHLVLVGQGEDEEKLREKTAQLQLTEKVTFAGLQKDIAGWLSAFDLFLFPSLFEGLSIAALEAQASGVVILASAGVVPQDVKLTDSFYFYDLDKAPKQWADEIIHLKDSVVREEPEKILETFEKEGYDIKSEAKKMEAFFCD